MIMRFFLFAFGLLCLPSTCALVGVFGAFSSPNADTAYTTWRKSSSKTRLLARRPVIVAGGAGSSAAVAQAALGADLALSVREFVEGANNSVRDGGAVSSVVVVQNADDGEYPSIEQYEDAIRQFDDIDTKPILHVILEGSAAARPLLSPSITDDIAFLGIEPIVPKRARKMDKVTPEVAQRCGCMLQEIVDAFDAHESQPSMAIMLDLPLHLSMLQANSLPKSTSAHGDSFLCRDTCTKNTYLVDYQYDYDDPFGGTDPLRCPTREISISAARNAEVGTGYTGSGFASAAAYTALRGRGVPSFPAACIASSVQAVIDEGECLPATSTRRYDVSMIAKLAEEVESAAIEQPVMRSRYIEFGYK